MLAVTERRLAAEWELLRRLAAANPGRITAVTAAGARFHLRLHGPSAAPADPQRRSLLLPVHVLRMDFPVHFPAVPMELFLDTPVFHPNIHPETGFVCLWERHRVSNTVEHALHKMVAMLSGELRNAEVLHVMQPDALKHPVSTAAMPLRGVIHDTEPAPPHINTQLRRHRLQ